MDDFNLNDAINALLNDPDTGEKLNSLISALSPGEEQQKSDSSSEIPFPDIGKILQIKELFDAASKESNSHTALLTSLKPYLSEERSKNMDFLLKMLKIYKILNKIKDTSLLKELF